MSSPKTVILDHPYSVSIHLIASESFTLPRYLWVVDKSACRKITLLTISIEETDLDGVVRIAGRVIAVEWIKYP